MRSRTAIRLLLAANVPAAIAVVLPGISAPAAADPTCTSTWAGASAAPVGRIRPTGNPAECPVRAATSASSPRPARPSSTAWQRRCTPAAPP